MSEKTAGFQQPANGVQVGLDGRVTWWCRDGAGIFEGFFSETFRKTPAKS